MTYVIWDEGILHGKLVTAKNNFKIYCIGKNQKNLQRQNILEINLLLSMLI